MKDYTETPSVVLLLRRAGATAGFVFGLALLALLMANNASADESRPDGEDQQHSLLGSVGDVVGGVTEAAEPVLRPVAQVTAPVLAPVLDTATPVLDAVVEPVAAAVGLRAEVAEVTDTVSGARVDVRLPQQPVAKQAPAAAPPVAVVEADSRGTHSDATHAAPVAAVIPLLSGGSGENGPVPTVPAAPSGAVPGGSGALGGFGGAHGADAAVTSPTGSQAGESHRGRGPPGTIDGLPWVGHAQPDCPS